MARIGIATRCRRINVLGVPFDVVSLQETSEIIARAARGDDCLLIATANVDFVMKARADRRYAELLWRADLVVPDGVPIVWAASALGMPLKGRVNGTDLVWRCAKISAQDALPVVLIGAATGVAKRAAACLNATYPGAMVHSLDTPVPLTEAASDEIVLQTRALAGRIILAAFGTPRQERWLERYLALSGASVGIGVGSAFDIICGDKPRAPAWMQRNGLEWLYRMAREPNRLGRRYILEDSPFLLYLAIDVARRFARLKSRGQTIGIK